MVKWMKKTLVTGRGLAVASCPRTTNHQMTEGVESRQTPPEGQGVQAAGQYAHKEGAPPPPEADCGLPSAWPPWPEARPSFLWLHSQPSHGSASRAGVPPAPLSWFQAFRLPSLISLPDDHLCGTSHLLIDISGMNGHFSIILFPVKSHFLRLCPRFFFD